MIRVKGVWGVFLMAACVSAGKLGSGLLSGRMDLIGNPLQDQLKASDGIRCHLFRESLQAPSLTRSILTCQASTENSANSVPDIGEHGMLAGPIPILFDLAKRAFQSFRKPKEGADDQEIEKARSKESQQQMRQAEKQFMLNKLLFKAAECGYAMETARLLRNGAQINERNGRDMDRWTALHYGAAFGRVSVCRVLLANGADPNIPDWDHWTPLHYAAYGGKAEHVEIARELLSHGADVFAANWCGKTPLKLAEEYAPPALVAMLEEAEKTRPRPSAPRMRNGARADRESFLRQLIADYPPPPTEGPGRDEQLAKSEEAAVAT